MAVSTPHAAYMATYPTWITLRDAFQGSSAVKARPDGTSLARGVQAAGTKYLARPAGMRREDQYNAYRDRAVWYGATERAVHGLTGAVFRREPQHTAPTALVSQLEDVTQTGVPWRTFAEQMVRETLLMGRAGILVDFPELETDEPDTPGVPDAFARPYWVAYQAEEILNWRTVQRQGDTVLSLVVLREYVAEPQGVWPSDDFFVIKEIPQYRVLRLNERGVYEVSIWADVPSANPQQTAPTMQRWWIPTRQRVPLDFIPFVFLAPFSLEPGVEKSLLEALVEVNFQAYRHSADYEHGLHMTALPTPYICATNLEPKDEFLIGSATAWVIPDSTASVGMLEFHGQGLQSHEHALESDIKNMAALGARLLEGQPVVEETATANSNRLRGSESAMQTLVVTVSQGLTQALQIHGWWQGITDNVDDTALTITLNTDLVSSAMEPAMLEVIMKKLLNRTITYETYYYLMEKGEMTRPGIKSEEEQALLDMREEARPLAPVPAVVPQAA